MLPSALLKHRQQQQQEVVNNQKPSIISAVPYQGTTHNINTNNTSQKQIAQRDKNILPYQQNAATITAATTPNNTTAITLRAVPGTPQVISKESNEQKSLPIPEQILKHVDNYIVFNEKLGGGQFSQVYKAMDKKDVSHQKYFAVKIISLSSTQFNKFSNYNDVLQKEIDILMKARHENLICMHDLKQTPNNLYLFLDYCNGGNLRNHLVKKKNRLSEEESIQFLKQMCAGYQALIEKHIIHRDLKPENILLHNGKIKIGDFGFARIVHDVDEPEKMTQKCSPLYAPPQILTNRKYSSKCDVWSMGCIFFEMLFGRPPFTAMSLHGLTENILTLVGQGDYPVPSFPPIGQNTKDLLIKMLRYHEKDRINWENIFSHPLIASTQQTKLIENVLVEPSNEQLNQSMRKNLEAVWENKNKNILQEQIKEQQSQVQKQQQYQQLQPQEKQQQYQQQTFPGATIPQNKQNNNPLPGTNQVPGIEAQQAVPIRMITLPSSARTFSPINQRPVSPVGTPININRSSVSPARQNPPQLSPHRNTVLFTEPSFAKTFSSPSTINTQTNNNNNNINLNQQKPKTPNNQYQQIHSEQASPANALSQPTQARPERSTSSSGLSPFPQPYLNPAPFKKQTPQRRSNSQAALETNFFQNTMTTPSTPSQAMSPMQQGSISPYEKLVQEHETQHNNHFVASLKSPKTISSHFSSVKNIPISPSPPYSNSPLSQNRPTSPYSQNYRDANSPNQQQVSQRSTSPISRNPVQQNHYQDPKQYNQPKNYNHSHSVNTNGNDRFKDNNQNAFQEEKQEKQQSLNCFCPSTENQFNNSYGISKTQPTIIRGQDQFHSIKTQMSSPKHEEHRQYSCTIPSSSSYQSNGGYPDELKGTQKGMESSGKTHNDHNQLRPSSMQSSVEQNKGTFIPSGMSSLTSLNGFASSAAATTPDRELTENEKYLLYMKQIKQQEDSKIFVSKIDNFFIFLRKRALFANATLLNFWNSTRLYQLPSHISCAVLHCLCSYYLLGLEQLRRILSKESEPTIVKEGAFRIYEKSAEYLTTKSQIQQDVTEAKQLFSSIEPFILSEVQLSQTSEARSFLKFVSMKPQSHEEFREKLLRLFPKMLSFIDLNNIDRSAAKGLHMTQVFTHIHELIPSKQYQEFDFNKFYDDKFNNLSLDELKSAVKTFNLMYFSASSASQKSNQQANTLA